MTTGVIQQDTPRVRALRTASYLLVFTLTFPVFAVRAQAQDHPVPLGKNPDASVCAECHSDKSKAKYVHTAVSMGCTVCHSVTSTKDSTRITLASPGDQLCFTCHPKSTDKVLHGPYGQGNCIVCHSPHASDFPNQLRAATQDLCMGCHVRSRLKLNKRARTVTVPWGPTLTFEQMKGWQYIGLNRALTANHPVEGHPVTGANTALGKGAPDITCLSCHRPHDSNLANLLLSGVSDETSLCLTCHKSLSL
jgi:predicted CXXCH cytochrome family protein